MPYDGEFAQYRSITRVMESAPVRDLLRRCHHRTAQEHPALSLQPANVEPSRWLPDFCIASDGSFQEVAVTNGFPGAQVAYLTLAGVILDVRRMRDLDQHRPVDPAAFRTLQRATAFETALPGCNVSLEGLGSPNASFRRALFDLFDRFAGWEGGESLLDTYEALLAYRAAADAAGRPKCPYENCPRSDEFRIQPQPGCFTCRCERAQSLYSTDALRIHEGMNPAGSNGAMVAEVMQTLERVWLVHILRSIEGRGLLNTLRRVAFVLDGPLAVFGHPAWLSGPIAQELSRINERARAVNGEDLLILGIEKTGNFAAHLDALDVYPSGERERLRRQTVYLLSDEYIKRNIIFSDSEKTYGSQTYFGRKFFYKVLHPFPGNAARIFRKKYSSSRKP